MLCHLMYYATVSAPLMYQSEFLVSVSRVRCVGVWVTSLAGTRGSLGLRRGRGSPVRHECPTVAAVIHLTCCDSIVVSREKFPRYKFRGSGLRIASSCQNRTSSRTPVTSSLLTDGQKIHGIFTVLTQASVSRPSSLSLLPLLSQKSTYILDPNASEPDSF